MDLERARRWADRMPPAVAAFGARVVSGTAATVGLVWYLRDRRTYQRMDGAQALNWRNDYPKTADRLGTSPYDPHYLPQDAWAAHRVAEFAPPSHVDVGSRVEFVCFMTSHLPVTFVDIRPLEASVEGLSSVTGSILDMPFPDQSVQSLSCLHVAEHIGLGRYGDPLDPLGTRKAATELERVLAPGGQLLFSLPVGEPRVCFNAHRVHDPLDVVDMFPELRLDEFASVDDSRTFRRHCEPESVRGAQYACGMYRFSRPS